MLLTWMLTSMSTAPPVKMIQNVRGKVFLTPEVWPETVIIVLEEIVQQDGDVADCLIVADTP